MENDKLDVMLAMREEFMTALAAKNKAIIQKWPVDIKEKSSQQTVRDTLLKGVEEIFESLAEFRNWKNHRQTENVSFNREKFLEEYVDAFNYFLAALVMMGIDSKELFDAYVKKDAVIHKRIIDGY
jgi:dimeric dUTPase (all-alpha-NTP-PPase superfamily)